MRVRSWTTEQFVEAVKNSTGIREVLREIGLKPTGGNYKQFHKYVEELGLDTSHFKGQGWNKGKKLPGKGQPLSEVLTENSGMNTCHLKKRLIKEGVFERVCSNCLNIEWCGQEIPLELEHINGISNDHRLENLCLLCPNCHALTDTYRGKNKGKAKG